MRLTVEVDAQGLQAQRLSDTKVMATIANAVIAFIRQRTIQGRAATGVDFTPYSTRPIYISRTSGAGLRLSPSGGRPSRTGRSVYYAGGYKQYKGDTTGTTTPNLTLSGQLLRSVRSVRITDDTAVVTAGGSAIDYARGVQDRRPFIGVAPDEMPALQAVAAEAVAEHIRRQMVSL